MLNFSAIPTIRRLSNLMACCPGNARPMVSGGINNPQRIAERWFLYQQRTNQLPANPSNNVNQLELENTPINE